MKKNILSTISLFFLSITWATAQTSVPDSTKAGIQFLQGDGVYENGVMYFLDQLRLSIWTHFGTFIGDAQALAAIFMIIFFAIKSYEMMVGDKQLQIMPLLRPFGLAMILIWWGAFVKVVEFPTEVITAQMKTYYESEQQTVDNLRLSRSALMTKVASSLYTYQAQTQIAEKESSTWYGEAWDAASSTVKQGISSVVSPVLEFRDRLKIQTQLLMTQTIETLAMWILRLAVYLVFFLQILYSTFLVMLGPFAVAASILPAFRDSLTTWIARFISASLYAGIGYLVMYLCTLMQEYAMSSEISRYSEMVKSTSTTADLAKIAALTGNGLLSFGTVTVSFFVGAICMFSVPSISTWIISTSGINSAVSSFGKQAESTTKHLGNIAGKLV